MAHPSEAVVRRLHPLLVEVRDALLRGLAVSRAIHATHDWQPTADRHLDHQLVRREAMERLRPYAEHVDHPFGTQLELLEPGNDNLGLPMSGLILRTPTEVLRVWHSEDGELPAADTSGLREFYARPRPPSCGCSWPSTPSRATRPAASTSPCCGPTRALPAATRSWSGSTWSGRAAPAGGGSTSTGTSASSTGCAATPPERSRHPARRPRDPGQQNGRVVHRGRQVDPGIARSWLLVNGARTELFDGAHESRADQVVLDIEDAVDPARKPAARADVVEYLTDGAKRAWVRINDRSTEFWSDDVDALKGLPGLAGVMLAKTEAAEHVTETADRLGGATPVLALVESALGIEEAVRIASARGAFRLAFGSGDYRRDTGTSADDLAMAYPRSRLVIASRVGGLPGPIDGPTVSTSHPVLREQSALTVSLGLTGKLCLDMDQLPVINEVISPAPSDVAWARDFLADFDARGQVIRDGSDLPRLGRARKIEKLATAFGVEPN